MLHYHESIIRTIVDSLSIAVDTHLRNAAALDPLTGCYSRRALDCFIQNDFAYAKRTGTELSAIMFDLDNFKEINDIYGHQAGDAVLKEVCSLVTGTVRKSDYLARYGGEEFVVILPDTSLYSAVQLSHKIRKKIESHLIPIGGNNISVTASFGVASIERKTDAGCLLKEADERLYKAKSAGKNTVVPSLLPCFAGRQFVAQAGRLLTAQMA